MDGFKDWAARAIFLRDLQGNGRFYTLIVHENTGPKLTGDSPFLHWSSEVYD